MKVTYNWLKEFVDFDLSPADLADLLTMLGLEVEGMEQIGGGLDEVVVARVVEKAQHPNADKLSLCRVDNGREVLSIVCGAQNFQQGDTVALAQIGAELPGEFRIKRSKIRGEESFGMLCSERELGLAEESAGIMVLPADLPLGKPLFEALGLKDTVFEIGLTPNRADCLSVIGIAREIAAKLGTTIRYPDSTVEEGALSTTGMVAVEVQDPAGCPRYAARYVSGCRISPSPPWLVNRLQAVGIRSINNVVDVTNLILVEMGHPLHAFDYRQVADGTIVVRRAAEGELFRTLDGQERRLLAGDLVICDRQRVVALAGIMGGENSEITDDTTDILIESAFFHPPTIRRTSKRLGLHTESSHRFERGADIEMVPRALDRAAMLIAQLAGGSVAAGRVDVYTAPKPPMVIGFRPERANALLGISLTRDEMVALFCHLNFTVADAADGALSVTIPSYRVDMEREIDLVEELCRLNGFDKVPASMPRAAVYSDRPSRHQHLQRQVRDYLVSAGLTEIISFSFIAPDAADRLLLPADDARRSTIALCNPLAEEQSVMRTTLLPGLLETAARNINFRNQDLALLEMRRVYLPSAGGDMPTEPIVCAGLLTGRRAPEGWAQSADAVDFFDVKGLLEGLFESLGIAGLAWESSPCEPYHHPGKSARVMAGRDVLGTAGELHPTVLERFGIDKPVFSFELDFERLVMLSRPVTSVTTPSRYPDIQRDVALLVPVDLPASQLVAEVGGARVKELESVQVFDYYTGTHVPVGQKSIALRLRYRLPDRTLTDDEVNRLHGRILEGLTRRLGVTIR
jgi:phenylalanyl-tRNA synthetase beta chain